MKKSIQVSNSISKPIIETTNVCPFCKMGFSDNYQFAYFIEETGILSVTWLCPSCSKTFLSYFKLNSDGDLQPEAINIYPIIPEILNFNKNISNISPNFVSIYNQAKAAEDYGLNEICGIGYRKSLEFLIKDYCIFRSQNEEDIIKSLPLGQVINDYIDSSKIKNLAKVSAWLGNDEAHYVRKITNKDINDLKKFIDTTVYFISYDLTSDEADELISSK